MTKKYSLKTVTSLSIALNRFKNNKSSEEGRKVKRDTSLDSSNRKVRNIYIRRLHFMSTVDYCMLTLLGPSTNSIQQRLHHCDAILLPSFRIPASFHPTPIFIGTRFPTKYIHMLYLWVCRLGKSFRRKKNQLSYSVVKSSLFRQLSPATTQIFGTSVRLYVCLSSKIAGRHLFYHPPSFYPVKFQFWDASHK